MHDCLGREWQLSTLARPMPAAHLDTVVEETGKVPARVWRAAFTGFLETPDFSAELSRVTAPALIVWGNKDAFTTRAMQERLLSVLPQARLIVYEGAGHSFHWEDAGRFARDLSDFILPGSGTPAGSAR